MTKPPDSDVSNHPLQHVAIIMDGNGRWARSRGLGAVAGHNAGVEKVRGILDACQQHNISTLTLFAFSSENWQRPSAEVGALMSLFASYLKKETRELCKRNIRLRVIGERGRFSARLQNLIADAERATSAGSFTMVLAVDYGGRWDILQAARQVAVQVRDGGLDCEKIDEELFASHLSLGDLPMPDLCIRTAGEQRISNFLLWQLAYTELYFAKCYWPDFDGAAFEQAVQDYYQRQRRFGLTTDQSARAERQSA